MNIDKQFSIPVDDVVEVVDMSHRHECYSSGLCLSKYFDPSPIQEYK